MIRSKLLVATILISGAFAHAQTPQPGQDRGPSQGGQQGQPPRGPGGLGGPGGDVLEQIKAPLRASEEEWQVLAPALRKVINARRVADAGLTGGQGRPGMRGGMRGGPPGGAGNDAFDGPRNTGPGGQRRGGQGRPGGPPMEGDGPPPDGGPRPQRDNVDGPPPANRTNGGPSAENADRSRPMGGPGGGGPGGGGPGGPGGPGAGPTGPVAVAMTDLRTTAESGSATPDQLKAKITAVRAARDKARGTLVTAVDELKALITPEQEALLVGHGILE